MLLCLLILIADTVSNIKIVSEKIREKAKEPETESANQNQALEKSTNESSVRLQSKLTTVSVQERFTTDKYVESTYLNVMPLPLTVIETTPMNEINDKNVYNLSSIQEHEHKEMKHVDFITFQM